LREYAAAVAAAAGDDGVRVSAKEQEQRAGRTPGGHGSGGDLTFAPEPDAG
jgi:hypothetical protein